MRQLYSALLYVLSPLLLLRLWLKGRRLPAYRQRWRERFGWYRDLSSPEPGALWFHTVSVGEFLAAKALIEHYLYSYDGPVLVTTMTPTGSERVRAAFGDRVQHVYLPYDLPVAVKRFLRHVKPRLFICLETELWPNLLHYCHRQQVPVVLANARLSEKSAAGYRKLRSLSSAMLQTIYVAAIQNAADAKRLQSLGLPEHKARVIGSIKFDLDLSEEQKASAAKLREQLGGQAAKVWIAASTHKGEDEIILRAFKQLKTQHSALKLILVPRHPERFDAVYQLCRETNINTGRRSAGEEALCDILLGDTMGELLILLGAADFAFIGGSFIDNGGHNYIEAAIWKIPILTGPSTYNFHEIASMLVAAGGMHICEDEVALATHAQHWLEDSRAAQAAGERAFSLADQNRGAMQKLINIIDAGLLRGSH